MIGYEGPRDQWEVEIAKASKSGLLDLIGWLVIVDRIDRTEMLKLAKRARKEGRYLDSRKAFDAFIANPEKSIRQSIKKRAAAKRAARKRKKEAKAR